MTEQDEGPLAEWLFFARKQRRRRTTHSTHTTEKKETDK